MYEFELLAFSMHDALIMRIEVRAKAKAEEIHFRFYQEKAMSLFVILF